jgi:hypothetical protein
MDLPTGDRSDNLRRASVLQNGGWFPAEPFVAGDSTDAPPLSHFLEGPSISV